MELVGLAPTALALDSPADLLRADAGTAPFRARPELDQLFRWRQEPAWFSVRLVVGPGGQGKTRLARHLASQLRQDADTDSRAVSGWASVVIGEHVSKDDLAVVGEVREPTLVVVDYAESRGDQLDPLIAAARGSDAKMRLLLLARTAGRWRTDRVPPGSHLSVLGQDRIVVPLSPLEPEAAGREHAWRQAVSALSARLPGLAEYSETPWDDLVGRMGPPDLTGEQFRTILAIQMHALATLLQVSDTPTGDAPGTVQDAMGVLLEHEQRYWTRVAERFDVDCSPTRRRCLVALGTLWGATTRQDAIQMLRAACPEDSQDTVGNLAEWLSTLYRDNQRYVTGLQPDLLGEYLISTTLTSGGDCTDRLALSRSGVSAEHLEYGLTIIGRAHSNHPNLATVITDTISATGAAGVRAAVADAPRLEAPGPLLDALGRLIETNNVDDLGVLVAAMPPFSLLLGETAARANAAQARLLRVLVRMSSGV